MTAINLPLAAAIAILDWKLREICLRAKRTAPVKGDCGRRTCHVTEKQAKSRYSGAKYRVLEFDRYQDCSINWHSSLCDTTWLLRVS